MSADLPFRTIHTSGRSAPASSAMLMPRRGLEPFALNELEFSVWGDFALGAKRHSVADRHIPAVQFLGLKADGLPKHARACLKTRCPRSSLRRISDMSLQEKRKFS